MGTVSRIERFDPSDMIAEKEVMTRYPGIFRDGELSELRKQGLIGHIPISRQRILYRPVDIEKYLQERFVPPVTREQDPCPPENHGSSNTKTNGSDRNQEEPVSIDTGFRDETLAAANLLLSS